MEGSHPHAPLPLLPPRFLTPPGLRWGLHRRPGGVALRWAHLPCAEARATCILVGGFGEFAEKYFETMNDLSARGLAVWFLDWRGQGGSTRPAQDPTRPTARDFVADADDLAAFAMALPDRNRRVVIAHSMGAAIALLALARRPTLFDAAVLSAPMLGLDTRPVPTWLAPAIAAVPTWCGFGRAFAPGRGRWRPQAHLNIVGHEGTHDPLRAGIQQAWCLATPELRLDGPTYGWVHAAFGLTRELARREVLARVRTPVLLGCAGEEYIVDAAATRRAARLLPRCELESFASARHELFLEVNAVRARWLEAIRAFLRPLTSRRPAISAS